MLRRVCLLAVGATVLLAGCPNPPVEPPPMSELVGDSSRAHAFARNTMNDIADGYATGTLCRMPVGYQQYQYAVLREAANRYNQAAILFNSWIEEFTAAVGAGDRLDSSIQSFKSGIIAGAEFIKWARDPSSCSVAFQPGAFKVRGGPRTHAVSLRAQPAPTGGGGNFAALLGELAPLGVQAFEAYNKQTQSERKTYYTMVRDNLSRQRWDVYRTAPYGYATNYLP